MITPDFERCTTLATELLYKQNIEDRILNIQHLDYGDKTIIFDSIQNYAQIVKRPLSDFLSNDKQILKDGCTLILGNETYLVLYNDQICNWEHLNWTLAHEIGHIYMGHLQDGKIEEIEAHYFAAQLFMPEYSIYMMTNKYETVTKTDLIEIFGVSEEAANKRLQTMRRKTLFSAGSKHKEIWNIQEKRVDLYYACKKNATEYRNTLDFILHLEAECNRRLFWQLSIN